MFSPNLSQNWRSKNMLKDCGRIRRQICYIWIPFKDLLFLSNGTEYDSTNVIHYVYYETGTWNVFCLSEKGKKWSRANHFTFLLVCIWFLISFFLFCFSTQATWLTLAPSIMDEEPGVAVTSVKSILIITSIIGNSLVCAVILKNPNLRYVITLQLRLESS